MAVVSNYSLALDIKPKIAWTENQEKSLTRDYPFVLDRNEDPSNTLKERICNFFGFQRRVKNPLLSSEESHPLHALLDRLLLTARSITDKYRGLPTLLDKICNEEEAEELGIEESMVWYALSYEKSDQTQAETETRWTDEKWRAKVIQRMERREFLIQILIHFLLISLPGPRPSPSDPPAPAPQPPIPALSHVKRRKVRQEKIMAPKPTPPSLTTEDHLERLMDKLSMWQLMGDLDPTGTPKARKRANSTGCNSSVVMSLNLNEEKEAAKDDASSADIDTRPHKRARTSVSVAEVSIKRDSSKLSKHLTVSSSSSSTRHPSPALSTTSSTSHTRERHPSRPLERSRSRSLSVTLAEEEHQKAVEAKERQRQRADSVGIGGVKKRVLSREVSMTRVFKPKARSQTTMVAVEKTVKPVVKTEPKDLVVTLVEATPEKPRIVPGRTLSRSQLQQAVPPLPLLLPHSSSSASSLPTAPKLALPEEDIFLQPGSQQTGQSRTRSKSPGPNGLNLSDLSELSELSEPEGDVDEVGSSDAEVEPEEIWYPPASSSPDVLLLSDKSLHKQDISPSGSDSGDEGDDDDWQAMNTPTKASRFRVKRSVYA
ncbi:hypothetical protein D9758_004084 [Tetrapyrgos nigripes]|uniref:DNA replication regulator Sld3 C-terminal domain-containing protein n=1 Tax=Tetrapyrgos nigripes TaxID=182062 RepID=A0A8H5GUJ9_9AGAR|nr:hypothetical protein D9758_004084 [Tetrapyrgos nigripes]